MEKVRTVVIGAGQAGLCVSHFLTVRREEHVLLERNQVGHSWRTGRWDSFRLVTPTWQWRLPDRSQPDAEGDDFLTHTAVAARLERWARAASPPLRTGVAVLRVEPADPHGFHIETSGGALRADQVVVAVGTYHQPQLPPAAAYVDRRVVQLHTSSYRNPAQLPAGAVLVVGSGQSGWQIARELHRAGRDVHWSLSRPSRMPRQYRGRDIFRWMEMLGLLDVPIDEHPAGALVREEPKPFVCEYRGDAPEDPRALAQEGLRLHGRLVAAEGRRLQFRGNMRLSLQVADESCQALAALVDTLIEARGIQAPDRRPLVTPHQPREPDPVLDLDRQGVSTIIWATGYRSSWKSWLRAGRFDRRGYPLQTRGLSLHKGLHFVGPDWLHTWGSGLLYGVSADAEHVVRHIAGLKDI